MECTRRITVYGQEVMLDANKLAFSEGTLSEYLETEGGWIDYFGAKLAEAERQLAEADMDAEREEDVYDQIYGKMFATLKETDGGSDKKIEGLTKSDPAVVDARKKVLDLKAKAIECKYIVRLLYQHLRAWDKNHENAQNRGNTLRKEMERLHKDTITGLEDKMNEIIKAV